MQLTNYGFIESRGNYISARSNYERPMERLSTGLKINHSRDDVGAISQTARQRLEIMHDTASRQNLQNARSYLTMQQAGLEQVRKTYTRMEYLAQQAIDPVLGDADRAKYDLEFQKLAGQLDELMGKKFNGLRLFNQNMVCGDELNIPLGELDYRTSDPGPDGLTKNNDADPNTGPFPNVWPAKDPNNMNDLDNVIQTIRGQTLDVQAPGGTLTFSVNSGTAGEIYRVFMGGLELFSTGPSFTGSDPTVAIMNQYNSDPTYPAGSPRPNNAPAGALQSTAWGDDSWLTSGSANSGDKDTFKIKFGPGIPTTFEIDYGASNPNASRGTRFFNQGPGAQGQLLADGGVIRTANLPFGSKSTNLTLHFETKSIGVISDVKFEPQSEALPVPLDSHDNGMTFDAKGFGTLSGHSIATLDKAKDTLDHLAGKNGYYGEINCIANDRMPAVAAEMRRVDMKIAELEDQHMTGEATLGRIQDADVAQEATNFAKQSLKMELAANIMSRVTRLTDVLLPLATQRVGGPGL
jgi:flagellin-like hook-associated protein FlgL